MTEKCLNASRTAIVLLAVFSIHRMATFSTLNHQIDGDGLVVNLLAYLTGFFSDVWTAVLGSFFISALEFILNYLSKPKAAIVIRRAFIGTIILSTSLHCSYVAFFQFPFIPSHLPYFYDTTFLKGNFGAFLDIQVFSTLACSLLAWFLIVKFFNISPLVGIRVRYSGFFLFFIGISLHTLHNHCKVQWFIPEGLQYNFIEGVVSRVIKTVNIPSLSQYDLSLLKDHYGKKTKQKNDLSSFLLREQKDKLQANLLPIGKQLESNFSRLKLSGEKPLIIVYLMESARYYDMGAYGNMAESLSPQFDALTKNGILFHQIWSVSNVTRGGQEAVWCGYLSAIDRSLMKERQDIDYKCITDFPESGASFWHHGGEGRFDNQQWFWDKHRVQSTLSLSQLPEKLPKTGWGTGDLSLAHYSAKAIQSLSKTTHEDVITGMVLTVSNHIPWDIPSDAPTQKMNSFNFNGRHPSEKTVYYADFALGAFVSELKQSSLWEKSILIVTGDHGIRTTPLNPQFNNIPPDELNSRVPLLITGGITEHTARSFTKKDKQIYLARSQADIANFIAQLLGINGFKSMGEPLFAINRVTPIFSDLGTSVYFPVSQSSLSKRQLDTTSNTKVPQEQQLFYISLLHFLEG